MTLENYQLLTSRTNTDLGSKAINAAHVTLGIVGETQEFMNAVDDNEFRNGAEIEIFLEGGDSAWYISELANLFDIELVPCDYYDFRESIGWTCENIKKYLAYNKEIDIIELQKRLNSILFYIVETIENMQYNFEDCLDANITKLQKRFPEKFSAELALAKGDEN